MLPARPNGSLIMASMSWPDLRAIDAFVTVIETGSMASAAKRLGLSQSALSQIVKTLEAERGTVLFDREVRPARPTGAGLALLEQARALLGQARSFTETVRGDGSPALRRLRLGCVDSFAATVGPALLRGLSGPETDLLMASGLTPFLCEQLLARELDLVICTDPGVGEPGLVQQLVFSEAWVAVFPSDHDVPALAHPGNLQAAAGGLPLVRYSRRSVIGRQIDRWLLHAGIEAPRRFELDATDPMLAIVAAGLGWAVSSPLCLWQSRQHLPALKVVPLPPLRLGERDFFLLRREGEWDGLDAKLIRLTRDVIRRNTWPAIRAALPALPAHTMSGLDE